MKLSLTPGTNNHRGSIALINYCNSYLLRKILLIFLLLVVPGMLISCSLKTKYVSPEGTWNYPGGAYAPMAMVFHPDGKLTFTGGFEKFHPAAWHWDKKTQILRIKVSNYDKSNTQCDNLYPAEYSCLEYNPLMDTFECTLSSKTMMITFLGWNFLRK
jgi:hypothetical protein